jgi:radical SAM superfamily enzyme YgiQ (UPF0313 family)
MKILLIYPNIVESPKDISTGLAILAALCKKEGHSVSLIDSTFKISDSKIINQAKNFNPDLILITTATNDFDYAVHICSLLKKHLNKPIIAGGYHPTIAPEETIAKDCFDIICIGEGELALLEFLKAFEKEKIKTNIKNLWFKNKKGEIIKNPLRPLVQDLDSLSFPDREIFDYKKYLKWNHGTATFISTRGCPFRCSYCINHFLIKKYKGKGKYVRFRSIGNLFQEIKDVLKTHTIKNIEFYDDTFTLDDQRTREFCKRYPKEISLPFNINVRVNAIKPEHFKLLKKAGCIRVSLGIEAGDPYIRNKILKRDMTDEQIISTFNEARKAGLKTYSFNMVGIPFETKKSIEKTIQLNRKCKPDFVGVSIFNVFRGTEIYDICKKNNWIKKTYSKSYFYESNINHPNFKSSELKKIRNSFGFKVFLSYNPLRAVIDLIDRNLSQINLYIFIRSKIIDKLSLLRK